MAPATGKRQGRPGPGNGGLLSPVRPRFPGRRTILRTSFGVSILLHAGLLLCIQKAIPEDWLGQPLRTFEVELLRPPVDPLRDAEGEDGGLEAARADREAPREETEETISLDTKDTRYSSYARVIKERIFHQWRYPPEAKERLLEGVVLVLFSLNRPGELTDLEILASSGAPALDAEAARAVRAASPFPPFPGSFSVKRLHVKADFSYRLHTRP